LVEKELKTVPKTSLSEQVVTVVGN
jgi:hypothetical protein